MEKNKVVSFFLIFCFALLSFHDIVPHSHLNDHLSFYKSSFANPSVARNAVINATPINIFSYIPHFGNENSAWLSLDKKDTSQDYAGLLSIQGIWTRTLLDNKTVKQVLNNACPIAYSHVATEFSLRGPPFPIQLSL